MNGNVRKRSVTSQSVQAFILKKKMSAFSFPVTSIQPVESYLASHTAASDFSSQELSFSFHCWRSLLFLLLMSMRSKPWPSLLIWHRSRLLLSQLMDTIGKWSGVWECDQDLPPDSRSTSALK